MVETEPVRLAPEESAALGRQARVMVPRSSHAGLSADPDRPDPVTLLESQAKTRVPELVPIRHGRMMSSPFAFFRGAALGMAADLAGTPVTGITVQAFCGWTLARAHARSGDRIAIAAYLGSSDVFDRALVEFAEAYADRNERDHDALLRAVKDGRLQGESGI